MRLELLRLRFGENLPVMASISGISRRLNRTNDCLRQALARGLLQPDALSDAEVLFRLDRLPDIRRVLDGQRLRPVA